MGWFRSEDHYDRRRLLNRAARAARGRSRRQRRKAVALYRRVLEVEPDNPDLLRKLAPLLATTDDAADACASYRRAAETFVERGFLDRAVGVYRDALRALPGEVSLWKEMAALELKRGRRADALATLLEGRRGFRGRNGREAAMTLLWLARKADPSNLDVGLDLALQLGKSGAGGRGVALLEELLPSHPGGETRVRARQLRIAPSPGALWRYLGARIGRSRRPEVA